MSSPSRPATGKQRILVPIDFTAGSWLALREAAKLARDAGACITLLYVVDLNFHTPPTGPANAQTLKEELWREGSHNLDEAVAALARQGITAVPLIREGLPQEEIVEAAKDQDLIVIGRHKPRPWWRLFSRRTVQGVLEDAPCPVLVVLEQNQRTETAA